MVERHLTKPELVQILRKMTRKNRDPNPVNRPSNSPIVNEEDWYSSCGDDEEGLRSLSESGGEGLPRFPHYRY